MKIEISFTDKDSKGGVEVVCTPKAEILFRKYKMREHMTPAEAMAVICLTAAINSDSNAAAMDKMTGRDKPLIIV